ncbi:H+/Cl- antiporter ClcA [Sphingomonas sp. SORGH_AS802]|uniref:chloride channel protein n=1 Tax=Sphingomonas sp. SORGH_AS_0802 TaxID=3041800 RepID=UPI00285DB1DF|nr:chloride channel protein [Sphingomonas sp. SORGH_AS_0802]MDR6133690.1 H+/Cl- antiporter ClcA [Sphingomonas sp. SORGH_AS_0802]
MSEPDRPQSGSRTWTVARYRALLRARGPRSVRFRTRLAILMGAVAIGLAATLFALAADAAAEQFTDYAKRYPYAPLVTTPLIFAALVWVTRRYVPLARGSGIPQVIAAQANPEQATRSLVSIRTVLGKALLTLAAVMGGASVGREGPTVQIAAAVMGLSHRLLRVPLRGAVLIAGGAAGVAAAFNTPLAGLLFAIEELASAYEQRVTLLVIAAIVIAGMVAQSLQGDYIYFGLIGAHMPLATALLIAPIAGIFGGLAGGLFARLTLMLATGRNRLTDWSKAQPIAFAAACGLVVGGIGCATGLTWGTGYGAARAMIVGVNAPLWFGPAKFLATLATAVAGLPGGIFAPSLAVGAGIGNLLRWLFPGSPSSAIVILGMVGYFAGVVRAPLTAVIILSETTVSRGLMLPMFATAFIADSASAFVCREKLYHGLSKSFAIR